MLSLQLFVLLFQSKHHVTLLSAGAKDCSIKSTFKTSQVSGSYQEVVVKKD